MSDQVKHTPGPWTAQHVYGPVVEILSGPRLLADVYWTEGIATTRERYISEAEAMANARIMAAGRELLAALKQFVDEREHGVTDAAWDDAREAIAHAEGEHRE